MLFMFNLRVEGKHILTNVAEASVQNEVFDAVLKDCGLIGGEQRAEITIWQVEPRVDSPLFRNVDGTAEIHDSDPEVYG